MMRRRIAAVVAAIFTIMAAAASTAADAATYVYGAAEYTYDAPAMLPLPDTAAFHERASPPAPGVVSWGNTVVVGGCCTAANSVPASTMRFSQSSVNGAAEIEASMRTHGWVGDAIDVVRMPDGGLTSLDNTRLLAAQRAGIDVQANIRGFCDALPSSFVGRFTTTRGGIPSTRGDAVTNRIGNQGLGYGTGNPFGSWVTGWSGN